jgi:uncharacterized damage-inducible protein DinB
MIDSQILNTLLQDAFTGKTTWLEASTRYPLDEFIETYYETRARMQHALEGLTDAQAAYANPVHPFWSISETITHLIYSQGFYINKLLDISTSRLPHVVEAARGFGEGARQNIPADELRARLREETEKIHLAVTATRNDHDPNKSEMSEFFGMCTYKTWILLLLGHEVDHLRQAVTMRRLARTDQA